MSCTMVINITSQKKQVYSQSNKTAGKIKTIE